MIFIKLKDLVTEKQENHLQRNMDFLCDQL